MTLSLHKSYWMMKLLNRSYPAPMRAVTAGIAFGLGIVATGRFCLARELANRCWSHNDLKVAARRAAWYIRNGWIGFIISHDDFFDATEGLTDLQLDILKQFLDRSKSRLEPVIHASEMATIAARKLNNNSDPSQRRANIARFKLACDHLLAQTSKPVTQTHQKPRVGDFPIADAKQTLADFEALFPIDKLRWFVISGTFLGLIREKGFLTHDYDIDLGVFEDQIDIEATIATVKACKTFVLKKYDHHTSPIFAPKTVATNPDVPYILKLVHVTGIHIDLFIHYHDTSTDPGCDWHGSSLHRWENSAFELISYQFYDHTVLGPADADRYLTENYGDWRTPVTDFNCTTDTPNLTLVPHPIAIAIFVKRYVLARSSDPIQAEKLEMELLHNGFLKKASDGSISFSGDLFAA